MRSQRVPLVLTAFSEYELANALRFAEFRQLIEPGCAAMFLADFAADRDSGRIQVRICNLAEVVDEAKRLSALHTLDGGHRSFDILHVASALLLKGLRFLTFDKNQKKLAEIVGLTVPI